MDRGIGALAAACMLGLVILGAWPARAEPPPAQAQALFLFLYAPGPAWRAGVPMHRRGLGPHAVYMQKLQTEGRLFAGGGFASDDGGMAIVSAATPEEARALLAADPAVTSGIFVAELRHWRVRFRTESPLPQAN